MIGKVKVNKSFKSTCQYVLQEQAPASVGVEQSAEVLAAHGVRTDSAAHMAQDFQAVQALRPSLGKAVLHVVLAFPAEESEKLTNSVMGHLTEDYLRAMKIDPANTQWALIRHHDKAHPHLHLVVNRVDLDGQTVSDQFSRSRSVEACKRIEGDYGLIVADQVGRKQAREIGPTPAQNRATSFQETKSADWNRSRHVIGRALSYTANQAGSFDELRDELGKRGVSVEVRRRQDGSASGVVFAYEGQRVKGSQVGREYSAGNLERAFSQHQSQSQEQKAPTPAEALTEAASGYALAKLAAEYAQQRQQQAHISPQKGKTKSRDFGLNR